MSPHSSVFEKAIQAIISQIPVDNKQPIGKITAINPNFTSVVLWLRVGQERILLGADMVESPSYKGWTLLLEDKTFIDKKAKVYKVAHHGSENGDHNAIWSDLLDEKPICIIAPWIRGGNILPTKNDLKRISQKSEEIYLSHKPDEQKKIKSSERHIKHAMDKIKARDLLYDFGIVRLRKKNGESKWRCDCFGAACRA